MITPSTANGRRLAIAASLAFVSGALIILLGAALLHPEAWSSYHVLTVLTVFGTIAAGHLLHDAVRARHLFAAFGFLVLFFSGTALVVYQSVGRQAETTDAVVYDAEAANAQIARKGADLAKARKRYDEANAAADDEMTGQRCGPRCNDWRQRAREVQALIAQTEREIAALGPQKTVAPKAEKMASVAALFGADKERSKAILMLLEPFFWTLFFEIGSIVSLGFAFRRDPAKPALSAIDFGRLPEPETFSGELPEPPKPRKKKSTTRLPENVVTFAEHPVVKALKDNGGSVASNRALAKLQGISDGESSKRWQEVEHMLEIERVGKRKVVRLKAAYM